MLKPVMLFVDDEKVILDSLERQLQSEFSTEFSLLFAESGEEGLEILTDCISNQIKVPVVLADYLMPGIKGDQFLINVHQRLPETRKIMLTGQADLEEVTKVINHANLYRYLAKPWEKNDLILTIREAVTSFKQHQMIEAQNKRLQKINLILEDQVAKRTRELGKQKDFFQQVFQNSPDGMVIFDSSLRIIEINKAFEAIFLYQASDVKGKFLPDLIVPPEWRNESARMLETVLAGETVMQEMQGCKNGGMPFLVLLNAYPMIMEDSECGGVISYRDLTTQREMVELLHRSYERRKRSNFFQEWIFGKKDVHEDFVFRANMLGIDLKGPFLVMFFVLTEWKQSSIVPEHDEDGRIQLIDEILDWLSLQTGISVWGLQEGIGVIYTLPANHHEAPDIEKQLAGELLETIGRSFPGVKISLGLSEFRQEMEYFPERYQQARLAALIGARMHSDNSVHHYWDIGAFPLLAKLVNDVESERFLKRTIGKLLEHDRVKGTDLFPTLERIMAHDNLRVAADELFIHYKTLLFRKRTIEKILRVSLDSFEGRTLIGTAMTLHYFREMKYKL